MKLKDYDPRNPPYVAYPDGVEALYPLLEAFAPALDHDRLYKLNAIYRWTDVFIDDAKKQSVCKSGCNYCCAQKVAVHDIEIENIRNNLDDFIPRDNGEYCPLLDRESGECGVYKFRPLACRTMLTFDDPKYCESNETHFIYDSIQYDKAVMETFSELDSVGELFIKGFQEVFSGTQKYLRDEFQP